MAGHHELSREAFQEIKRGVGLCHGLSNARGDDALLI